MMNHLLNFKIFLLSLFTLLLIPATCQPHEKIIKENKTGINKQISVKVKSGYLFFTKTPLKTIYDKGGFQQSLTGIFRLNRWLNTYASAGFASIKGKSLNSFDKTSIFQTPIDIGLEFIVPSKKNISYSIGFGGRYSYLTQHNDSLFVDRTLRKHCGGIFVNNELTMNITDHWLIGIFGQYVCSKTTITPSQLNVFSDGSVRIDNAVVGASVSYGF